MDWNSLFWNLVIGSALGWLVGRLLTARIHDRDPRHQLTEAEVIQQELDSGQLVPLTVEVADSGYLCYNSITNDFVCQGRDLNEIVERFKARYPDKNAAIHRGDSEAVAILKAQLKARHENRSGI